MKLDTAPHFERGMSFVGSSTGYGEIDPLGSAQWLVARDRRGLKFHWLALSLRDANAGGGSSDRKLPDRIATH